MVGIPIGTRYTSTLRGRSVKDVICEKCCSAYVYAVERKTQGQGTSLLWLDNDGARNRADAVARAALEKALLLAVEPIACPACGWYQEPMVREARRRRGKWLLWPALVIGLAGAVLALGVFLSDAAEPDPRFRGGSAPVWACAACLFGLAVVLLFLRHLVFKLWDPNTDTMWKRRRATKESKNVMLKADYDRLQGAGPAGSP